MTRRDRIARLAAHRARRVDAATVAVERACAAVEALRREADDVARLVSAARIRKTDATADDLVRADAYVRSLSHRARHIASQIAAAREEENARRAELTEARIELRKLEVLDERLAAAEVAEEERALRRAVDDRVGAISATRSRNG